MGAENGAARPELAVPEGMVMIPLDGKPSDIIISTGVAVGMLANLLDRDEVTFTVLLAEGMTGLRLAKVRSRDQAGPRPGPEDRAQARAGGG
jgi:hypothetical protein